MKKYYFSLYFLVLLSLFSAIHAYGQWPPLSVPNVQVSSSITTGGELKDYWACTDDAGGSFCFFTDDRLNPGGNESVYCQRIDKLGVVRFIPNGVPIGAIATAAQNRPKCTSTGTGSAIVCWQDSRNGGDDIYAQKIDSSGVIQWVVNGVLICNAPGKQNKAWIVSDGSGGAIIAWEDARSGTEDIYAQRIDASGTVLWTVNGVIVCNAPNKQTNIHMIPDGAGGAIITWEDKRNGTKDIYAQRIDAGGNPMWTVNGVPICIAAGDQKNPKLTTNGSNGAIITWSDKRGVDEDIYAQHVNSIGVVQWTVDGIVVCNAVNKQKKPVIASDQSGGAVIAWEDKRAGIEDVYAQRISATGVALWTANGNVVCNAPDKQKKVDIEERLYGGTLIVWEDKRTGVEDIYVQVLDINGNMLGTANGIAVSTAVNKQSKPFVFRNAGTDWIVVWKDDRNAATGQTDLYAQGLNPTIIPVLPIELLSFDAIRKDNIIELTWVTASEINNDYFIVEKSKDGKIWEQVVWVDGAGNSNNILEYYEIDDSPYEGVSYYRLKQVDFDGNYSYSDIIPVAFENNIDKGITILPNPVKKGETVYVEIKGFKGENILLILRDMKGREFYAKAQIIETNYQLKALQLDQNIPAGTYLIIASSANGLVTQKIIIE